MEWTKEQAQAIELRDKNILVAAAAGSGKTAVLVERIKQLILKDRCPIDRMLIVTFTNAAASEMREKIEKAIKKSIQEASEKGDRDDMIFLKKQLDLLPLANISTFHSFALEVIHRFFYLINKDPNFKICDDAQQVLLQEEAMDRLTEEMFAQDRGEFYDFLNKYSGDRNENDFREMIQGTFKTIQSLPEPMKWLKQSVRNLDCTFEDFLSGQVMDYVWSDSLERIRNAVRRLQLNMDYVSQYGPESAVELCEIDLSMGNQILSALESKNFEAVAGCLDTFKMTSMTAKYFKRDGHSIDEEEAEELKAYLKKNRQCLKDEVPELKEMYFFDSIENIFRQMKDTYPDALLFEEMLAGYGEIFDGLKSKKNLVDFSDIEHYAYDILKDSEAADFYRKKFRHIFIDEYQDSNVIQEALIDKIKRENNLFMVGDVKQSIYKFRLAEPEIFEGKYRDYTDQTTEKGDESLSCVIDLNKNFRSKKSIIDFINLVFEKAMRGYDSDAALYLGASGGEKCNYAPKLFLAETEWEDETGDAGSAGDTGSAGDELKALIAAEKEALAAAKIIKESLGKTIFDSSEMRERPLMKRDIVILMRAVKSYGDIFYKILSENNLPSYVDDNDGYFDTIEINTFMALLAILDNEKQDVPLLTVMRSEILNFSIPEMAQIRIENKEGSYYDAFAEYAESGEDLNLRKKCADSLEKIAGWRKMAGILPLEDLVWELMLESGFYIAMGAMPAGSRRQANLRALVDKALNYRDTRDGSLYGFMSYIEAVKEKKVTMGQVKIIGENDDSIRIMTVHKSKGLEFPMVLLAGLCRKLNYTSIGKGLAVHKDLGIGFSTVNYREGWFKRGIIQNAIKQKIRREEVEEQKRILYVAMTRAKDILYLLGIHKDPIEAVEKVKNNVPSDMRYFSMIGETICESPSRVEYISNDDLIGISKAKKRAVSVALNILDEPVQPVSGESGREVERRMNFSYPHEKELRIKSKYSVSELNQMMNKGRGTEKQKEIRLKEPASFKDRKDFSAAQVGTFTHKVLEKLDFRRALEQASVSGAGSDSGAGTDTGADSGAGTGAVSGKSVLEFVKQLIEKMVEDEFLTEDEARTVNPEKIADFVLSPLGRRIGSSGTVIKEQPFNMVYEVEGCSTMVQGIMDCVFEEDGELVLVDYKTTNIRTPEELEARRDSIINTYRLQMDIYREALAAAKGKKVKASYLYLTNIGCVIEM